MFVNNITGSYTRPGPAALACLSECVTEHYLSYFCSNGSNHDQLAPTFFELRPGEELPAVLRYPRPDYLDYPQTSQASQPPPSSAEAGRTGLHEPHHESLRNLRVTAGPLFQGIHKILHF